MFKQTIPIFINTEFGVNTTQNGSRITTHLSPPIEFNNKKASFRVIQSSVFWSIPNISANLNNNVLNFNEGGAHSLTFDPGLYDLNSLNENISQYMVNNGLSSDLIVFTGDSSTSKVSVQLNSATVVIDWTTSTVSGILGFTSPSAGPVTSGTYIEADNIANLNSVTSILINCNFSSGVYFNNKKSTVIASIVPNVSIGSQIIYEPINPISSQVHVNHIDEISFWLTNQNNEPIDTNGESYSILGEFVLE